MNVDRVNRDQKAILPNPTTKENDSEGRQAWHHTLHNKLFKWIKSLFRRYAS
jgi:hypothetical protein